MQLFTKVIIGIFVASFLQWLNYSFFIGFVLGTLTIIIVQYNYIMKYLQEKHKDYEISVTSIQQHAEEFLHPIKVKPKHYINRFNMELQVQNPQPQSDKQWQLQQATVIKLGRKKYLKRIETYQDFLDELKDAQQQHGQLLCNLDSKLQIENELTQLHKFKEENSEVILSLTGVQMTNQMHLLLPQWKDYKKIMKFFGHQHIDVAKTINHCVQEQIVTLLKNNYSKEMEEFRKQRRKLKNTTVECYQHYQKILNEYYQQEKELQTLTQAHAEMIKRKDDPASIIKSEMKVKLQIQQQDNIRLKLTDSRDSLKENSQEVEEFNNKLSAVLKSYEEQRIVFTKQCFQNSLIGIEDMATKMQTLISSLIIILDEDNCQIFPQRVSKSPILSPQKSFTDIPQNPQLGEMSLNDQQYKNEVFDDKIQLDLSTLCFGGRQRKFVNLLASIKKKRYSRYKSKRINIIEIVLWRTCSPNFTILVKGSANGLISLWDFQNSKLCGVLNTPQPLAEVTALEFADSYPILVSLQDILISIWNIKTNECLLRINIHHQHSMLSIANIQWYFGKSRYELLPGFVEQIIYKTAQEKQTKFAYKQNKMDQIMNKTTQQVECQYI